MELRANVDPIIFASWKRCKNIFTHQTLLYNPKRHLQPTQNQQANLTTLALPYMEDTLQFIEGSALAIVLTDHNGVVLAVEVDKNHVSNLRKISMTAGDRWSEDVTGTNAIGLSLITAMPMQVVGAEHFFQFLHDYAATAAPIHDEHGVIIGTISILTLAADAGQAQLALVMATAKAISNQLQSNLMLEQANHRLRQLDSILESVADGVITWNTDGVIESINQMACQIIGLKRTLLLGNTLNDVIQFSHYIASAIKSNQELLDIDTRIQIGDRIVQCLISIRPIYSGTNEVIGGMAMLRRLAQVRSLVNQQASNATNVTFADFHYASSAMQKIISQARTAAKGSAGVLIIGEVGVGKTVLAQAIHNASPRAPKPFVVINCGMIPTEFMVEELLGKEAHDSQQGRPSKFELADGGTLLFDMIDQLSIEAQHILLHVIASRQVNRVRATRPTTVNVRIIATTSQDMETLIANQSFVPQLYYLFNAFRLCIPPLRQRRSDSIVLAEQILSRVSRTSGIDYHMGEDVPELLQRYPWPGNVRELESVIERAVISTGDNIIRISDLPENIRNEHSFKPGAALPQKADSLQKAEYDAIIRAGWACNGVISDMAEVLGINRSTLWRKFKQHGLSANDFKQHKQ